MPTVAIVGASLAGSSAAATLREEGFVGRVVLIGAEPQLPYDRPPLSKNYLRGLTPFEKTLLRPADFYRERDIEMRLGTTVTRALESAAAAQDRVGTLAPQQGETRLFITPGYRFRVIDRLLTNFHLPESTLLMLVCAFGGYERMMAAYHHAVAARYRFFSYGDAMLIEPAVEASSAR